MDKVDQYAQVKQDLTMMLLYLNSFKQSNDPEQPLQAWRGHDFDTLDALKNVEMIEFSYHSKSISICKKGEERAKELLRFLTE